MTWRGIYWVSFLLLAGCGSATDVGNPTVEQLVGIFQAPSSASGTGDTASPAATGGSSTCRSDATKTKQILAASGANQLRLVNFLSYSDGAADVTVTYTAATGAFDVSVNDGTANLTCTGSASTSGGTITIALTCTVTTPAEGACTVSYQKVN